MRAFSLLAMLLLPGFTSSPAEEVAALNTERISGDREPFTGAVEAVLHFDGYQDYMLLRHSSPITNDHFSFTAWVNPYALRGQQMILGKNVYALDQREWGLLLEGDAHFRFYMRQEGWQTIASTTQAKPGHWHHLAVTMEAGHVKLYVNGALEDEVVLTDEITPTEAPISIGGIDDNGNLRQMFQGALDDIIFYHQALPADVIQQLADVETEPHTLPERPEPYPLWTGDTVPSTEEAETLTGLRFEVIKPYAFTEDGYRFLHGVALAWHKDRLYASFGHNRHEENFAGEEARGRVSEDAGKTWSEIFTIDSGDVAAPSGISHGVFLSHEGTLWAFHGAFGETIFDNCHTRAYTLDETTDTWTSKGVVVEDGFFPLQEPQQMADGNWIMGGARIGDGHPAAVAISDGDDFTQWELVVIPKAPGLMWGESSVILLDDGRVMNIARYHANSGTVALVAFSEDFGRSWSASRPSNLPMAASKPYTGTLSTGAHYLIGTTTSDSGNRRSPLTIALTRPGESTFSKIFVIRHAEFPEGPGESHPNAALSYPYAVEHEDKLYVGYSNNGGNVGRIGEGRELANNNSAELAVIPIEALAGWK